MGESQVIFLKDIASGVIYFSAVIDCYTYDSINKTIDLLTANSIKSLDLLCWTHPDDDHSIGINEIFDQFCETTTLILLPEGVYGNENDFVDYNSDILDFFVAIKGNNIGRKYNVDSASAIVGQTKGVKTLNFVQGLNEIKFQISALAPIGAIIRRRIDEGLSVKNDISIALLVEFGELSFFFAGDIENQTIGLLPNHLLSNLSYLKTPHHTSNSSDNLLRIFNAVFKSDYKIPLTCSTAFRKYKLPNLELVNNYKTYTESFFTTHDDSSLEKFGVIKVEFNPFDNSYKLSLLGSSRKLY